jgi:hypothetical protein
MMVKNRVITELKRQSFFLMNNVTNEDRQILKGNGKIDRMNRLDLTGFDVCVLSRTATLVDKGIEIFFSPY